ncbi:hypothetical protein ACHAPA_005436 [Fusarium lateritium]
MTSYDSIVAGEWISALPQVLQTFREICDDLARDELSPELRRFYFHTSARIFILSDIHDGSPDIFSAYLTNSRVLQRLLHLLDRIGTGLVVSKRGVSDSLPGLAATLQLWSSELDHVTNERLSTARKHLDFGSKQRQDELIDCFREAEDACRMGSKVDKSEVGTEQDLCQKMRQMPPLDICPLAQLVYSALDSSNSGPCDMCKVPHGYGARLCIETYRAHHDVDACDFDMFLGFDKLWHEARIRPINKTVVKFVINDREPTSKNVSQIKKARVKNLCRQIKQSRKRWMFRLNFEVRDNELWKTPSERSKFVADASEDVVTLSHFIAKQPHVLNGKTKRILAVLLGYAVLHLHGTEWMQPTLCSDDILFFKTSGAVPLKPYLQVRIKSRTTSHHPMDCEDGADVEEDDMDPDDEQFYHPYPCLVSLALILIELHQARPIQDIAKENNLTMSPEMTNEDRYLMADQIFASCQQDFEDQTRMAIDACLDQAIRTDSDNGHTDDDSLRTAIYQNIVRRLEDELEQGHSNISIEDLDVLAQTLDFARYGRPIKSGKPTTSLLVPTGRGSRLVDKKRSRDEVTGKAQRRSHCPSPGSIGSVTSDLLRLCFFDDQSGSETITTTSKEAYTFWRRCVLDVFDKYATEPIEQSPIKIVVLDTGLYKDHADFHACDERIKALVSYVGTNTRDVRDTSGHGTHVTSLLCEYAPDADIYVVKIADSQPVSSSIIACAIDDAVKKWQPDIITMSFGWPARDDEYDSLEKAIKNAQFNDVLLFAAASNDGANAKRAWPARHSGVICVHSTAADGNPSSFNPIAVPGDNFAIIGEAVEGAWPRDLCEEQNNIGFLMHKSGTSFATPIAAGIAAFLLQYARSNLSKRDAARLKQFEGMTAALRRISVVKHGYNYIAPRLHPDNFFGKGEEFIRTSLQDALS